MADIPDAPTADESSDESKELDVAEDIDAAKTEEAEKLHIEDGDGLERPSAARLARWRETIRRGRLSRTGSALVAGGLIVATLAGLNGWLGYRAYQKHEAHARQNLYVATARQGA